MLPADIKKVAIIDPIGSKAGMDYYDNGLMHGLNECGTECYVFSNYSKQGKHAAQYAECFAQNRINSVSDVFLYVVGFVKASYLSRKKGLKYVFLHHFSANWLVFIGYLIVRLFGLKIVTIAHDISSFSHDDNDVLRKIIYNFLSYRISVHNEHTKDKLLPFLSGEMKDNSYIAHHGDFLCLANNSMDKKSARRVFNLPENKTVLLFFGQIKEAKGLSTLINAMALVDDNVQLVIAGKPWNDDIQNYEKLIDQYDIGSRVHRLFGYVSSEDRNILFKSADVLVLPYREIYESGVLIMGLSYGLPVIASNLRPFETTVGKNNLGVIFEANSEKQLALAINKMVRTDIRQCRNKVISYVKENHLWSKTAAIHLQNVSSSAACAS